MRLLSRLFLLLGVLLPSATQAAMTVDAWQRDLAYLREQVPATHPNAFHKLSRAEFDARLDTLSGDLPRLSEPEVIVRIAEIMASLGEGHTRLTPPMPDNAGFFLGHTKTAAPKVALFGHLPIRLTRAADGYVVTRATAEHRALLGAEVVAIAGQPLDAVEERLLPVVQGDNASQRANLLPTFMVIPEMLRARGVAPRDGDIGWRFRTAAGRVVERKLVPVAADHAVDWVDLRPDAPPATAKGPNYWFERRRDGLIYARIAEVLDHPGQSIDAFAGELYAAVAATPNPHLVLDLRGNPGGNNGLIDPIVRGAVRATPLWQPGQLFVLTDGGTFSAAMNLANQLERWTPALFVGTPTGGSPNSYGDAKKLVLPESGLTVRVSTLYWQDAGPQDKRDAITPLLPTEPTIADIRSGRDPALAAIDALLAPPAVAEGRWEGRMLIANRIVGTQLDLTTQGGGYAATLAVPDLKLAETPFERTAVGDGQLEAAGVLRSYQAHFLGRFAGDRLVGWADIAGRPRSFIMTRKE